MNQTHFMERVSDPLNKPERPKVSVRVSGGTPSGFPDYRPINKLPRDEQRALLARLTRPVLYQVVVEDRKGNPLRVSPKCSSQTAQALASAINTQVALGREKLWSNATVVLASF
jgi:hypothetical protein